MMDRDPARLESAMRTLVSPLEYAHVDDWRRAVNRELKPLVGADMASFQFPGAGTQDVVTDDFDPKDVEPYLPLVRRFQRRLWHDPHWIFERAVALRVFDREDLYGEDLEWYRRSAYYQEYIVRIRAFDALMAAVPVPASRVPVQLYFHWRTRRGEVDPDAHALLRLLHPALEAGVRAHLAFREYRGVLTAALDAVQEGVLLLDMAGRLLHRNRAAGALLEPDPEAGRVLESATKLAGFMGERVRPRSRKGRAAIGEEAPSRTVRTTLAAYRLRATLLHPAGVCSTPLVLVTAHLWSATSSGPTALPPPERLRARFALTPRQAEVALLLARRMTNREIAGALDISPHTARHHTEVVMRKLGVSSRRKVRRTIVEPPVSS